MLNLFKKKKKGPKLIDLNGNILKEGDLVDCLRYEMGKSKLIKKEDGWYYQSLKDDRLISYGKMIDASNELQKVRKLDE